MSRTAFTGGEGTLLLQQPHAVLGMGLAVHVPATVWSGTINGLPSFPADGTGVGQLTVATATGALASILPGYTVIINGIYYTYCRRASSGTTLYIDGLGEGTVQTSVGTSIVAIAEFMPWPRRQRYSGATSYMNFDTAYTDQNTNFGPQAVLGCSAVHYADGSVDFAFDGSRSKSWTPGESISAYLWTFPDATTAATATATWTTSTAYKNGAYVSLRVTESTTGLTHTGYRLIFKFDSSNKPKTDFEIMELSGEWGSGWTCKIRSADTLFELQNSGSNYYTARNHVVLFGETAYSSTIQSIGGNFPGRENIWFDGWVTNVETVLNYDAMEYVYTIETVDGLLKQQAGMPIALDDVAAATTWLEMVDPTLDIIALHLCKWRSTILDVVDVTFAENAASGAAKMFGDTSPNATLWAQLQQIYGWLIGGTVSCDAQSGIYCEQDAIVAGTVSSLPHMFEIFGSVSNPTYTLVREGSELADIPQYIKPVAKFTAYGVNYSTPVGSRSPDDPIQHGAALAEISAGLLGTQAQLNTWAGRRQAQLNRTSTGRRYPLVGIIRIDSTPQSDVSVDGVTWNFVVRACEIEFDSEHGMAYTTIDCEKDVSNQQLGTTIVFT